MTDKTDCERPLTSFEKYLSGTSRRAVHGVTIRRRESFIRGPHGCLSWDLNWILDRTQLRSSDKTSPMKLTPTGVH